jgi:hypothetical protein
MYKISHIGKIIPIICDIFNIGVEIFHGIASNKALLV